MVCKIHDVPEIECACPMWSDRALQWFRANNAPVVVPKRIHKEMGLQTPPEQPERR